MDVLFNIGGKCATFGSKPVHISGHLPVCLVVSSTAYLARWLEKDTWGTGSYPIWYTDALPAITSGGSWTREVKCLLTHSAAMRLASSACV